MPVPQTYQELFSALPGVVKGVSWTKNPNDPGRYLVTLDVDPRSGAPTTFNPLALVTLLADIAAAAPTLWPLVQKIIADVTAVFAASPHQELPSQGFMMSQHVSQTDFPQEQAKTIGTAILTRNFTVALIPAAWIVAEYALTLAVPIGATSVPHLGDDDPDEAIEEMIAFCDGNTEGLMKGFPSLNWAAILKAILAAIVAALA